MIDKNQYYDYIEEFIDLYNEGLIVSSSLISFINCVVEIFSVIISLFIYIYK